MSERSGRALYLCSCEIIPENANCGQKTAFHNAASVYDRKYRGTAHAAQCL